jgi:hypothetical protein
LTAYDVAIPCRVNKGSYGCSGNSPTSCGGNSPTQRDRHQCWSHHGIVVVVAGHCNQMQEILQEMELHFSPKKKEQHERCENIHSWISLVGDLAFSHQGGIYGFKFTKRFSGDLFLRSHNFTLFLN